MNILDAIVEPNTQMSIIYRISVMIGLLEYFYIGSTETSLERRIWRHRTKKYYAHPNRKLYKTIREAGGWAYVRWEKIMDCEGDGFDEEAKLVNDNLNNPLCLNSCRVARVPKFNIVHRATAPIPITD